MGRIRVCVKGTPKRKKHCYYRRDIGRKGIGPKVVQKAMGRPLRKGDLSRLGYSTDKSAEARHRALARAVKKYGYDKTRGKLGLQAHVFRKRMPNGTKERMQADFDWLVRTYGSK